MTTSLSVQPRADFTALTSLSGMARHVKRRLGVIAALNGVRGTPGSVPRQLAAVLGVAPDPEELLGELALPLEHAPGAAGEVEHGLVEHVGRAGEGVRLGQWWHLFAEVDKCALGEHLLGEHGPGRTVDRGVVHLREDGELVVLEAFDDVGLPQRLVAVERSTDGAGDHRVELGRPARRRHGDVADMEVEVEVGVIGPVRMVETERHLDQATAQRDVVVDGSLHAGAVLVVRVERRVVGPIEDEDAAHVTETATGLQVEETGVESGELRECHGGLSTVGTEGSGSRIRGQLVNSRIRSVHSATSDCRSAMTSSALGRARATRTAVPTGRNGSPG